MDARDLYRVIRRIEAFSELPDAILESLIAVGTTLEFSRGQRLIAQFDPADFALIVLSGDVAVVDDTQHGHVVLAELSAPILMGEIGVFTQLRRTASVLALTNVSALRIERESLVAAGRYAPSLLMSVIGQLGGHIHSMNRALGLFRNGLAALERDEFTSAVLEDLAHPIPEVRSLGTALQQFARHIERERRQRDEMASAALLQRAMLPQNLGSLALQGRCNVYGDMKPARNVGGDFFDAIELDERRLFIAVGDVCGKGVPASLFMSTTITTLRIVARSGTESLAEMLTRASRVLYDQNPTTMFATLFCGVLDLDSGRFDYAIGGHNPPFLRRADGIWNVLPSGGIPLGITPTGSFGLHSLQLQPGEGVFLFTDGVTESIDHTGSEYGAARLAAYLQAHPRLGARELVDAVIADVESFAAGVDQFDDITCLAAFRT